MAKVLTDTGLSTLVEQIKSYVEGKVSEIDLSIFKVVSSLPTEDIDSTKIYLVPASTTGTQNVYAEYLYTGSDWEKLGEVVSEVDLSEYAKTADLADYAKTSDLSEYAKESELSDYAKTSDLDSYVTTDTLDDYAKTSDIPSLDGYVTEDTLSDYAKTEDIPEVEAITDDEIKALF